MPFSDSDDDDEDARKPAAQPTTRISLESNPDDPVAVATAQSSCVLPVEGEVPFLVTHWLSGFALEYENSQEEEKQPEQQAALAKIRQAAADLARAFEALGTFGQRRTFDVCMMRNTREREVIEAIKCSLVFSRPLCTFSAANWKALRSHIHETCHICGYEANVVLLWLSST
jgi:hypothetical protein